MIASCYIRTDDSRIGALAARLVYDDSEPEELRITAYRSLFTVRGMPADEFLQAASAKFRFPEDVDWPFVDTYLPERLPAP